MLLKESNKQIEGIRLIPAHQFGFREIHCTIGEVYNQIQINAMVHGREFPPPLQQQASTL